MVSLSTALRLPAPDLEALNQGRTILIIAGIFINPGRQFALYPADTSSNTLPNEQYYRPNFLPTVHQSLAELGSETVTIKSWAKCELCQIVNEAERLDLLSQLTVWTEEALHQTLAKRGHFFLTYLRVYQLSEPSEIAVNSSPRFLPISPALTVSENNPILSNDTFDQRYRQILNRQPPLHPELEELQTAISQLAVTHSAAKQFDEQIQQFIGWKMAKTTKPLPDWISTINEKGTAETGGKYEKGTAFENIVRQSLAYLGFEVDTNAKGGAGGMDLYCHKPYPMVGECKAGKGLGNMAVKELVELGGTHLGQETFMNSVKLVIGPGNPSQNLLKASQQWNVSIMNPMSLQKLVELQAKYPGSVNLIELKEYLTAGQIDGKIDEYIDKVKQDLQLRSKIIEAVKHCQEQTKHNAVKVDLIYGACLQLNISQQKLSEILIELSSPLTGYLGRVDGTEQFYFLRELEVN
ncbi:DUF1802 family protein [Limnoraphis robusta Tam1]|uniref:DUF1802 family protein n=1 Tax=Limnoraphis robusta CCNP1315 TaxID=3110306 RepID=A0ABU5U6K6_9CYAN|nr:DUF1802 family protein [Limnoraphis robusta]MEA5498843.1 DUF1802 family protein [Limnoraphis robusta BA-68 BA1]MEA5522630.1 DUF1802 family protein [Limnoraphis robusta CCNP1315]MEA5541903.1 DUF1802 family protein [Limnoraphis robusta Tam1]MEA5546541.1 DUF1802 family protein [Limnoraphis robusta CCNP1324]